MSDDEVIGRLRRRGSTYHLTNLEQSMSYAALGLAMAQAGVACEACGYATFRSRVVGAVGSPLHPLAAYFRSEGSP